MVAGGERAGGGRFDSEKRRGRREVLDGIRDGDEDEEPAVVTTTGNGCTGIESLGARSAAELPRGLLNE